MIATGSFPSAVFGTARSKERKERKERNDVRGAHCLWASIAV